MLHPSAAASTDNWIVLGGTIHALTITIQECITIVCLALFD